MNNPPIILADEPTGALDSKSGEEVLALLKKLHSEGRTIILITHDEKVAAHAERIIHIKDGKIIESSVPEITDHKIITKPASANGVPTLIDISETTKMAVRSLKVNMFRTFLTLLGIIIGVAAVIALLAIGNGSKQDVLDQISSMGTNLLSVRPGAPNMRSTGDIITLIPDDATAVLALDNVEMLVPERSGQFTLRYGNVDYASAVQGTGDKFPQVRSWPVEEGSFFTEKDLNSYSPVIIIGKTVVKNLFPKGQDPIGQYILVRNVPFEVIGIMSTKGAAPWGGDQDDTSYIPYTTGLIRLFGKTYINSITVKVKDVNTIDQTQADITELLKARHHGVEDFSIRNMSSIIQTVTDTQNTLTIMLGAVAAISLLVGGIGVMNIMLVSVTERTREIGIRMATGARKWDILLQFNTEAAVVCAIGGVIGIIVGVLSGLALSLFGMRVIFSPMPAILAFSCAFATGIIFGYLPARKAATLNPVIALASE
jgi:macrolide transport system ATP-binding/permease protein